MLYTTRFIKSSSMLATVNANFCSHLGCAVFLLTWVAHVRPPHPTTAYALIFFAGTPHRSSSAASMMWTNTCPAAPPDPTMGISAGVSGERGADGADSPEVTCCVSWPWGVMSVGDAAAAAGAVGGVGGSGLDGRGFGRDSEAASAMARFASSTRALNSAL